MRTPNTFEYSRIANGALLLVSCRLLKINSELHGKLFVIVKYSRFGASAGLISTTVRPGTSGGEAQSETNPLQTQFKTGVALSERHSWAGENS
jgi:hypothetical protein